MWPKYTVYLIQNMARGFNLGNTMSGSVSLDTASHKMCICKRSAVCLNNIHVHTYVCDSAPSHGGVASDLCTYSSIAGEVDYTSVTFNLVFDNETMSICRRVPIMDDQLDEEDEMFRVTLTTDDPGTSLDPKDAMVTIFDDDSEFIYICMNQNGL